MRYLGLFIVAILVASCGGGQAKLSPKPPDHDLWEVLVSRHVSKDGVVDYQGFQADSELLYQYLDTLSAHHPDPAKWTKEEQLAYWINAYNAFTIRLILEHYPLKSIRDITLIDIPHVSSPWDIKFFKIGGKEYDLNMIEHDILRKQFNEPRIHFAIVCASKSCPALRNQAYHPLLLEDQLSDQASRFINNPAKNIIEPHKLQLSQIFNWFQDDFTKQTTLIQFLNRYSTEHINADAKIEYLPYDWSLNGK